MTVNFTVFDQGSGQQRIQQLLEEQSRIQAELAKVSRSMNASQLSTSLPAQAQICGRVQRQDGPSVMQMAGAMQRTTSQGRPNNRSMAMRKCVSQHPSAPSATKTTPVGSIATLPARSMSHGGHFPPSPSQGNLRQDLIDFYVANDGQQHGFMLPEQSFQRQPDLTQVPEDDFSFGEDPAAYFQRTNNVHLPTRPVDIPMSTMRSPLQQRLSSSTRSSFSNYLPNTPNSCPLTTNTTLASDMSRTSTCHDIVQSMPMLKMDSNASLFSNFSIDQDGHAYSSQGQQKNIASAEEQNLLLSGAGGAGCDYQAPFALFIPTDSAPFEFTSFDGNEMVRSESNSSSASAKSRSKEQLQKQNMLAKRKLAPKEDENDARKKASPLVRLPSTDGSDDKNLAAITKAKYERPKHDRLFCDLCDHKEGFRGAHELGRHKDRQHKELVEKFVCKEPAEVKPEFKPLNPLTKCKACNQAKRYGAYYNAAAHLRRAHFVPKQRGRGKGKANSAKSEKRGGKGGGDWPPMAELKRWMEPLMEKADPDRKSTAQEEDDEDDGMMENLDEDLTQLINSNTAFEDITYPTDIGYDLSTGPAASNFIGTQFADMGINMNMPMDLSLQQQGFDNFALQNFMGMQHPEAMMADGLAAFTDGPLGASALVHPFQTPLSVHQGIEIPATGPMEQQAWY